MAALISNVMLDFKQEVAVWSKLHVQSTIAKIHKSSIRSLKFPGIYMKLMLLSPSPVTDLQSEIELMH